jgi:hypothetical protein
MALWESSLINVPNLGLVLGNGLTAARHDSLPSYFLGTLLTTLFPKRAITISSNLDANALKAHAIPYTYSQITIFNSIF